MRKLLVVTSALGLLAAVWFVDGARRATVEETPIGAEDADAHGALRAFGREPSVAADVHRSVVTAPDAPRASAVRRVRLVTSRGAPASGLSVRAEGSDGRWVRTESDAAGYAQLDATAVPAGAPWRIELVRDDTRGVEVPPAHVASESAEPRPFELPPFGFLEVTAVAHVRGIDLAGCSLAALPVIVLGGVPFGDAACETALPLAAPWRVPVALARDGAPRSRWVVLHVDVPGTVESEEHVLERPLREGEVRRVALELGRGRVLLRGRVLDSAGTVVADAAASFVLAPIPERTTVWRRVDLALRRVERRLDGEGRFALDLDAAWTNAPFDLHVAARDGLATARVELAAEGELDLGELVLGPPTLIAAGVAVDERGSPVAGVAVRTTDPRAPEHDLRPFEALTDAAGRFELRGPFGGEGATLEARADGFAPVRAFVVPLGTDDVRLELRPAGSVAGRIALRDLERLTDTLFVELVRSKPELTGRRSPPAPAARVDPDGSFLVEGVPAGRYDAVLRAWAIDAHTPRVEDVDVRAGEVTRDARLSPWHLDEVARVQEVTLLDAEGELAGNVGVAWRVGATDAWRGGGTRAELERRFVVPARPIDLELRSAAYAPEQRTGVVEPAVIRLRRAPRLVLRPIGLPALPHDVELVPRLARPGAPTWESVTDFTWRTDGSFAGHATAAGAFELHWQFMRTGRAMGRGLPFDAPPLALELDPSAGDREIEVPIDLGALERMLAAHGLSSARQR